jgi:hypothetical protein
MKPLALALALLALFATSASAKQIVRADVCGAEDCVTLHGAVLMDLADYGPPTDPPREAAPFFTAKFTVKGDDGHYDSWTTAFVPKDSLLRGADGTWMHTPPQAEAVFKRAARGLTAFPASELGPIPTPSARVDEVVAAPTPADDGSSWWLFAVLGLVVVLASWLVLRHARSPRRNASAAPTHPDVP